MKEFIDLNKEIFELQQSDIAASCAELKNKTPRVAICSIAGFPIEKVDESFRWPNNDISINSFDHIRKALGFSAVLTYMNKSKKSLDDLGKVCEEKKHFWAFNWIYLGFYINSGLAAELSLTRDSQFFCSWTVQPHPGQSAPFVANGSISSWRKFVANRDDRSFDDETRGVMLEIHTLLKTLLKESTPHRIGF